MLLSIIIPTHNCAPLIERAIRSSKLVEGCETEIIVIDDGSDDDTASILDRIAAGIPNLHVAHNSHAGLSSARNHGIFLSRGDYIAFLDADDALNPCDLSEILLMDSDVIRIGVIESSLGSPDIFHLEATEKLSGREYLSQCFQRSSFYTPCCAYLYRRTWLRHHGVLFDENIIHEDNLFTVEAILKAKSVYASSTIFYRYIRRPGSITTSQDMKLIKRRIDSYCYIFDRLTEIANSDPTFDLRWKIYEVIDGAKRLAIEYSCKRELTRIIAKTIMHIFSYRGHGDYALTMSNLSRIVDCFFGLMNIKRHT